MKYENMISVIVPVYNAERYLAPCLESILSQSFSNFELICIDNVSTDSSVDIIHRYQKNDSRVICIQNESNCGQAYSRNKGIDCASGKYIFFADADDMLKEGALKHLYQIMEDDSLDVVFFDADVLHEIPEQVPYKSKRSIIYNNIDSGRGMFCSFINNGDYDAVVWRQFWSAQFLKENNIKFFPQASPHEDLLFSFQAILTAKRVRCISDSYYIYRKHAGAITAGRVSMARMSARFISYLESLMFCRAILHQADEKLGYAILMYLNAQGKAVVNMMNELFQDGYSLDDVDFKNPFYNLYFQLFMSQSTALLDNYLLKRICDSISDRSRIIVYGAGTIGHRVMRLLEMLGTTNYTVAVTDNSKCTITESGKHIYNIEELKEYYNRSFVLVATAKRYQATIVNNLKELGFSNYLCIT